MFQVIQLVADGGDQRQEGLVDEQDLVLGVIEDVHQLLREQPGIDGMADQAGAGDTKIDFQVAIVIPGQGGGPVAMVQSQLQQRGSQLT